MPNRESVGMGTWKILAWEVACCMLRLLGEDGRAFS